MSPAKKISLGAVFFIAVFFAFQTFPQQPIPKHLNFLPIEKTASIYERHFEIPEREVSVFVPDTDVFLSQDRQYAFLTFDDGPSRNTDQILDILKAYGVQGTFFVVGHSINGRNDSQRLLQRILDEGHYIGLHSMTHQARRLYYDDGAAHNFLEEMSELQQKVFELTGGFKSSLCRAPYGTIGTFTPDHIDAVTASPLRCWDWNVDSSDWELHSVSEIMDKVKFELHYRQRSPHAVILFHEQDITLEALPLVIEYLLAEGYELRSYDPQIHFPINFLDHPDL